MVRRWFGERREDAMSAEIATAITEEIHRAEPPWEEAGPLPGVTTFVEPPPIPEATPVSGTVDIEQVVVGDPGPQVEPRPTAERYRSVPFRPDTVVDGWSTRAVTVRAASLRGHLHRYDGAPRQDEIAVHTAPSGRVIGVVADGVSAAVHSHVGANTAVTVAVQWLMAEAPEVGAPVAWDELVRAISWQMAERGRGVLGLDEIDPQQVEQNSATTLIAAIVDPGPDGSLAVEAIGVGDSTAWVLRNGDFLPVLGGKSDGAGGIASSAVAGLPRVPAIIESVTDTVLPGEVLLLGSDGIGDPLGGGQGGVGELLRSVLTPAAPSPTEFAHMLDFSRETFDDDRSLIAVWPRA
ncbi:hypothetical protein TPB0596_09280 [Tsukamurella pulmonis]|uniref:protein phosphatase 2C domain-containing protein n=1 Tax=Tsukamurella pulmonis TaxID=47312 RepID=UPI001EE14476|nr:protein phosphatase 2C domain-containing protein [Tsukamurella pulmonis]BDD81165.1 hypothetical protein TPB0596_09280 [Tsukamurella pulmonis]